MAINPYELAAGGVLCAAIITATLLFMASQQPVQEVITSEAKESTLIKAIYIDEYARLYTRYGMKFTIEEAIEKLFSRGAFIPDQLTRQGIRKWFNITEDEMLPAGFYPETNVVPKDSSVPVSIVDDVVYYRWCNMTSTSECNPITLDDITKSWWRKNAISQSFTKSFFLGTYLAKFTQYTKMHPEITYPGNSIEVEPGKVTATSDYRVVVRVGGYAGVNSSEEISVSVNSDILKRVETAANFVLLNESLQSTLDTLDLCSTLDGQVHLDAFKNNTPTQVGNYTHWINVTGSMSVDDNKRCMMLDVLHHLEPKDFRFRTELQKCQYCES